MQHKFRFANVLQATLLGATLLVAANSYAGIAPGGEVPAVDLRSTDLEQVRARASKESSEGVVVILFGNNADADRAVRDATREAAGSGIPVKSILLASPDATGSQGVSVYGIEGMQYGTVLPVTANLKHELLARIQKWRSENRKITADGGVQRCRSQPITGSRVRREKVCTTAREDADRNQSSQGWMRDAQNKGGNESLPSN